jgi:hypothetical protein
VSEGSKAAKGCFGVIGFMAVGSCVMIGLSNDKPPKAEAEATAQVDAQPTGAETSSKSTSLNGSALSSADVEKAEGTVAFIIGLNGYHCIKVIDAQAAGSGVYDVTCITDHHGHEATYMVNSRTNDVAEL